MKQFLLILTLFVAACSNDTAPLTISDLDIRQPMPGMKMSAGYFVLRNNSSEEIVITRVTSPQFGSVELHESLLEDGVSRMVKLENIPLPAESTVEFVPGGKHLMLMRPAEDLSSITLEFYAGDAVVLTVTTPVSE